MSKRDYYEVLGVEKGADDKAIKSAFRKLAMANHPDRNQGDSAAENRFREANEAYDTHSPAKPNLLLGVLENQRVDDATQRASRCRQTHDQCTLLRKVTGQDGGRSDDERATSQTTHDALRQEQLPVFLAKTGHHQAKDDAEGAEAYHQPR